MSDEAVTVYGASDDLIEVEGAIREEFSPRDADEPTLLAFSTGVVLRVVYDRDGIWRITPLAGASRVRIEFCTSNGEGDDYSDKAYLTDRPKWLVACDRLVRAS